MATAESPYDMQQARRRVLDTAPHLVPIEASLAQAESPLPALGVDIGTVSGSPLPYTFIAYAHTQPGEGFRTLVKDDGEEQGRARTAYGLALPIEAASRQAAAFYPLRSRSDEFPPLVALGWWPSPFILYQPGQAPRPHQVSGEEVVAAEMVFSTWAHPLAPARPEILGEPLFTASVVQNILTTMRNRSDRGFVHTHFSAVGQEAVAATLGVLQDQAPEGGKPPAALVRMLDSVAADLQISY